MTSKKPASLTSRGSSVVFTGRGSANISDDNPIQSPITETPPTIIQHSEFFFDNTLIAIQIENVMFNVHKYQLTKSEIFSDMFSMPKPESDEPEEGSSPKHPIIVEGVSASDFTALLRVLYASHFSANQPTPEASLVIPAFRMANMFKFSELRSFLLPLAEGNLDDVDKVVFAREFDIKGWLVPAHVNLCQREKPLNAEEARKLGVESVLLIWRMREQHRSSATTTTTSSSSYLFNTVYCPSCSGMAPLSIRAICEGCGSYGKNYCLYKGPGGTSAGGSATTSNHSAIQAGVKKWVEDGCTIQE